MKRIIILLITFLNVNLLIAQQNQLHFSLNTSAGAVFGLTKFKQYVYILGTSFKVKAKNNNSYHWFGVNYSTGKNGTVTQKMGVIFCEYSLLQKPLILDIYYGKFFAINNNTYIGIAFDLSKYTNGKYSISAISCGDQIIANYLQENAPKANAKIGIGLNLQLQQKITSKSSVYLQYTSLSRIKTIEKSALLYATYSQSKKLASKISLGYQIMLH